jgi:hypothetical protein
MGGVYAGIGFGTFHYQFVADDIGPALVHEDFGQRLYIEWMPMVVIMTNRNHVP